LNKWADLDNIELYTLKELLELRDIYKSSIEYDGEAKGYRDPKYQNVILKLE